MIIGVFPMDLGYKLLWREDNVLLEDVCDLGIYINDNEVLQDYINECFRNTYEGRCLSKMYVVSLTSKIENNWGEIKEVINSITPVGRIDRDGNKFYYQDMSSVDKDKVNYDIDYKGL